MRQEQRITRKHPRKIDASIDCLGERGNFRVSGEALAHGQHAREQERRVDRGQLARPLTGAGPQVDEVIEPATLLIDPRREESKGGASSVDGCGPRHPAAFRGNAQTAQPEANRSDAADVARVTVNRSASRPSAVAHDSGRRVRVLPEEEKRAFGQIFEERIVFCRNARALTLAPRGAGAPLQLSSWAIGAERTRGRLSRV